MTTFTGIDACVFVFATFIAYSLQLSFYHQICLLKLVWVYFCNFAKVTSELVTASYVNNDLCLCSIVRSKFESSRYTNVSG